MKTSNKILWGTFGLIVLMTLVSFIYVRVNLTPQNTEIDTSNWQVQIRATDNFSEIQVHAAADVYLTQGERKLELRGSENTLAITESYVENGKLIIKYKDRTSYSNTRNRMKIFIATDSLTFLNHTGVGHIESEGVLTYPNWNVVTSGANDSSLEIEAQRFTYVQSGVGRAQLLGTAESVSFTNSGAGSTDAVELEAKEVSVHGSGVGSFDVHATEQLNINLSGAGSVRYKGNPRMNQNISGVGSVSSI